MNIYKDIHCPHFIPCSGCTIDENVNHPPLLFEVDHYFKGFSIPFEYFSDKVIGWRYRAKLAVRSQSDDAQIGLYEAGTHHVVNIPLCRVHHPHINQAVEHIKTWICNEKIVPYDERTKKGLLRYIQCVVERSSGRVQLTLVINDFNQQIIEPLLKYLWDYAPNLWHSLWINLNTQTTNTIFGKHWHLVRGEEYVWEILADTQVCFHPANFAQANLDVFERMLLDLKSKIPAQKRILEYYAGVGVFGLCLAEKTQRVHCCEINPFAQISFEKAYAMNKNRNILFSTGSVVNHLDLLDENDLVIVDPPRKGLDPLLLEALLKNNLAQEVWYISCGWPSFKRDCQKLLKHWSLVYAKAYLFFPGTNHLEILAQFKKA